MYIFRFKSTVLRNTRLVPSELSDGGNWSGPGSDYSYEWSSFFCVNCRTFLGCLRCPSMVDCFLVKCFCTRSDDRSVQEVKRFFVIALTHAD